MATGPHSSDIPLGPRPIRISAVGEDRTGRLTSSQVWDALAALGFTVLGTSVDSWNGKLGEAVE